MKLAKLITLAVLVAVCPFALAQPSPAPDRNVPKEKQTSLGLYLTSPEAYAKWKADPDHVRIVDVRTPEEFIFVGHPSMAWNVPLELQTHQWDANGKRLVMKPNPEFLAQAKELFKPADTLLLICRSGGRSAMAVDALASAGFKQVYSIIDGVEGDIVSDPDSAFYGKRMKNGWKNAGLPWNYEQDPAKMRLPDAKP